MNYELLNEIKNILNNDFDRITILKTLISSYKDAKELFISANNIDCKNNGDIFDYDVFINLLQHSFSKDYLYHKETETIYLDNHVAKKVYTSKGICGVSVYNNELYSIFEIIVSNLLCHNITVLNIETNRNYGTIKLFVDITNTVIYNLLGIKEVIFITKERYEQFENINYNFDFMVFIGNNKFIKSRIYDCTIPYLYYCVNEFNVIYSSGECLNLIDKNLLNNQNVNMIEYDNIKSIVNKLNNNFNYCCSILTNNKEDAKYFTDNVKSRFIFINSFPFLQNNLEIELTDLLDVKVIFK